MRSPSPPWLLVGAGNMGTLAALYLTRAGQPLHVLRTNHPATLLDKRIRFHDGRRPETLSLKVTERARLVQPVKHLLVACKTPYTAAALTGIDLATDVCVIRLQNGLGSLDGQLPAGATVIEAVTTSAARGRHPIHEVVAENRTWMGGPAKPPAWFDHLNRHWPGLSWSAAIRQRQWQKLVANAVINPLTALYDVPNGRLLDDPVLSDRAAELCAEADTLLARLDPDWPGDSQATVEMIAKATAGNTSSMRADLQRGALTEIDAINGWLLAQAAVVGLPLPAHADITSAVRARHPLGTNPRR